MATFADLIASTRNELMSGWPDRVNQLGAAIPDTTSQSVTLSHSAVGVSSGTRLSIGLEDMLVIDASGQTATVIRGWGGSTAATHSQDDLVYIAPNFSNYQLSEVLNTALHTITSPEYGLYRASSFEFEFVPSQHSYDLDSTARIISGLSVHYDVPGPTNRWIPLTDRDWQLDLNANTTDFPSGKSITLHRGGHPGFNVRLTYKAGYTPLTSLSDDLESVAGLQPTAHDIPVLYAAYRLNVPREVKRSFLTRQPEPRRQDEVPPGASRLSSDALYEAFIERVRTEAIRLQSQYPEGI